MSKVYVVEEWYGYDCSTERTAYSNKSGSVVLAVDPSWSIPKSTSAFLIF